MNILLTGVAGFVGFSLCKRLLEKRNIKVIGFDNINDYYSQKLKKKRIEILKKNKNFIFYKKDINNLNYIKRKLHKKKIDYIFHFAAQAGVRYSAVNPDSYIKSNIDGFYNILKLVKIKKPKKFIFASSSSVYGDAKYYPSKENFILKPKNIYALSKKFNEELAENYLKKIKTKIIGLRFFTLYGPWGRPDMLLIKFFEHAKNKKYFKLNSKGNHLRDFTYIEDAINLVVKLSFNKSKEKYNIFNLCSSKPLKVFNIIKKLKKITDFKKIKIIGANELEVVKTYGSNIKILTNLKNKKFRFTNFEVALKKTHDWYKEFNKFI